MFFSGYGNISCQTVGGRILTMVYAIFGIPLVLAILNDLGSLFCKYIVRLWKKIQAITEACRKYKNNIREFIRNRGKRMKNMPEKSDALVEHGTSSAARNSEYAESETDSEDEFKQVPVTLALTITFSWIFFCASLFLLWEKDWNYFQAFYFFFVSLSTIGLGDITPTKPRYMVMNFGLVIVGLSLVSMTLSVIQMNIEAFLYRVLRMIQEEYEAAVEAGIAVDKDHIINRVLGRQPWYLKKIAPMVMTHTQKQHMNDIVNCASNVVKVCAAVQCDKMQKNQEASPVSDHKSFKTVASQAYSLNSTNCTQTNADKDSNYEFDEFVPMFMKFDVETQTDPLLVKPAAVQAEAEEAAHYVELVIPRLIQPLEQHSSECFSSTSAADIPVVTVQYEDESPHDIFQFPVEPDPDPVLSDIRPTPLPPKDMHDAETQVSILITAVQPRLYVVENSLRLIDDMVYEGDVSREVKCFMETAVQTDDSYLKLAKKLETLKMNRAKSLAIWVSPVARKQKHSVPGTEQEEPKEKAAKQKQSLLGITYASSSSEPTSNA